MRKPAIINLINYLKLITETVEKNGDDGGEMPPVVLQIMKFDGCGTVQRNLLCEFQISFGHDPRLYSQ